MSAVAGKVYFINTTTKKSSFVFVFTGIADLELLGNILIVADQV